MPDIAKDQLRERVSAGIGGTLSLEFANTAGWHLAEMPSERLLDRRAFLRWCSEQQLISAGDARKLVYNDVGMGPILELREAIFRIGLAIARQHRPDDRHIDILLASASSPLPGHAWASHLKWRPKGASDAAQLLGLIARDALVLFSSARSERIRVCAGNDCGWLFLDESRGKPRRWCSMSDCGNRAKARSSYGRLRMRKQQVGD